MGTTPSLVSSHFQTKNNWEDGERAIHWGGPANKHLSLLYRKVVLGLLFPRVSCSFAVLHKGGCQGSALPALPQLSDSAIV